MKPAERYNGTSSGRNINAMGMKSEMISAAPCSTDDLTIDWNARKMALYLCQIILSPFDEMAEIMITPTL